ncbi:MAG: hypothetical protein U1B83_08565, partial [Candidatus Cloacimonadaceae bacterium]|nr:hypothetical protein [Candidatus Cloacimonadaceae bacterium]
MISIQSRMAVAPQAMCEYQASQDGKFAWFVCAWHPEKSFALEEIQAEIKLEIINSGIRTLSKMEAEKWIKDLFADFHWKLHARFRKTDLVEKGISLFFGI